MNIDQSKNNCSHNNDNLCLDNGSSNYRNPGKNFDRFNCNCCCSPSNRATGAVAQLAFNNPLTTTPLTILAAQTIPPTFTGTLAISGADITFTPPSNTITLAPGHSYIVTYTTRARMPSNSEFGAVLELNGTSLLPSFTITINTGNTSSDVSLAGSAIITGGGTLQLNLAVVVSDYDITITELI